MNGVEERVESKAEMFAVTGGDFKTNNRRDFRGSEEVLS